MPIALNDAHVDSAMNSFQPMQSSAASIDTAYVLGHTNVTAVLQQRKKVAKYHTLAR